MKAAVLTGIGKIEIRDLRVPEMKTESDVLLRTSHAGICGSDIHYFLSARVGDQVVKYPAVVGHECSAYVEKAGREVTKLKPGDRVAVDPAVSCGTCDQCRNGRPHTCRNLRFLGYPGQMDGCLAEFFVLPERNCFLLPGSITMAEAALVEPLSIALYALEMWSGKMHQSIGILGSGPIGLCVLISARALGIHKIFTTDKVEERIHAALNAGALWAGNPDKQDIITEILKWQPEGLDAVFACCGDPAVLDQGIELLKPGGKLFILGIPLVDRVTFDISQMRRKEIAIQNVRRQNRNTEKAIHLIADRHLDVAFLATHTFELEETQTAFETATAYKDGVLKAMIAFD